MVTGTTPPGSAFHGERNQRPGLDGVSWLKDRGPANPWRDVKARAPPTPEQRKNFPLHGLSTARVASDSRNVTDGFVASRLVRAAVKIISLALAAIAITAF